MSAKAESLPMKVRIAKTMSGWWTILVLALAAAAFIGAVLKLSAEPTSAGAGTSGPAVHDTAPAAGYDLGNGVTCHQCR